MQKPLIVIQLSYCMLLTGVYRICCCTCTASLASHLSTTMLQSQLSIKQSTSHICTVVHYSVLEVITKPMHNGKFDSHKYKTVKNIEKLARIYHY